MGYRAAAIRLCSQPFRLTLSAPDRADGRALEIASRYALDEAVMKERADKKKKKK